MRDMRVRDPWRGLVLASVMSIPIWALIVGFILGVRLA